MSKTNSRDLFEVLGIVILLQIAWFFGGLGPTIFIAIIAVFVLARDIIKRLVSTAKPVSYRSLAATSRPAPKSRQAPRMAAAARH